MGVALSRRETIYETANTFVDVIFILHIAIVSLVVLTLIHSVMLILLGNT